MRAEIKEDTRNRPSKNYYDVLEVSTNAKIEEIFHSYQRAKAAYSSDSLALYSLMSSEECKHVIEEVEEAYLILSDPAKRRRYDEAHRINSHFSDSNYNVLPHRFSSAQTTSQSSNQGTGHSNGSQVNSMFRQEHATKSSFDAPGASALTDDISSKTAQNFSNTTNITKLVTQRRFALDHIVNPDFENEIATTTHFTGEFLRKIREYKSVDLERLSDMTKISRLYLQSIESEDYDKLPVAVYVRGFVFQYAKFLKLKPDIVANSYIARMKKLKP